jgi:hypothetical protein
MLAETEDMLAENQFGTGGVKGVRDATGTLRVSEQTLNMGEKLCACFIDWQKASDRLNWLKTMHSVRKTAIDGGEGRVISNLYVDQSVKLKVDEGRQEV